MKTNTRPTNRLWLAVLFIIAITNSASAQLVADFQASVNAGCSPVVVYFTNTSTGNPVSTTWYFGNGNQSTKGNPGAVYYEPGSYDVTLVVTNISGQKDSITKTGFITVYEDPEADFTAAKTAGCIPLTINFDGFSVNPGDSISSWVWDFGDGLVSYEENPTHTYTTAGNYDVTLVAENIFGCKTTMQKKSFVVAAAPVKPNFSANVSNACDVPLSVTFSYDDTPALGATYLWNFGDGNTSTQQNPSHTYNQIGVYDVTLSVTDSLGCTADSTINAMVSVSTIQTDFAVSKTSGCVQEPILFSSLTSPKLPNILHLWDFGDGNSSSSSNPTYSYKTPGTYTVKLKAITSGGCVDSVIKTSYITISPAATVAFSIDDSISCATPFTVNFTDKSANAAAWLWNFGDGNTSTQQNPSHTYAGFGNYSVSLQITTSTGCIATISKSDLVRISKPKAQFNPAAYSGCTPFNVSFTNESSSLVPIQNYYWDFGDGNMGIGISPSHVYTATGTYKVKLIVETAEGCRDSSIHYIKAGSKPTPAFIADKFVVCPGTMIQFSNQSVNADSFFWDFGKNKYSGDVNPLIEFETYGDYTIKLVAFNNGCADTLTKSNYIKVLPPLPDFVYKKEVCDQQSVSFYDSSKLADSYLWDFGDGNTSNLKNPTHYYATPGTYKVTLQAWNISSGCDDIHEETIVIPPKLFADFNTTDTSGCMPYNVKLTAVVNQSVSYLWEFTDGQTSTQQNPNMKFDQPGIWGAKLTVTNSDGCTYVVEKSDLIRTYGPKPSFIVNTTGGCVPLTVQIINQSTYTHPLVQKRWDFGDGNFSTANSDTITYTYTTPPANQYKGYNLALTLTDNAGCTRVEQKTISPTWPKPAFGTTVIPGCGITSIKYDASNFTVGAGPLQFAWDFGNGLTSTDGKPTVSYDASGTYLVKLVATDINGCKDSVTNSVTVSVEELEIAFDFSPKVADCPDNIISFSDTVLSGQSSIAKWMWDFGDGTTSSVKNPKKLYHLPGNYTVKLIMTDSLGCVDTFIGQDQVIVKGAIGTYTIDKHKGCLPLTVNFNASSPNASDFTWDMGDGTILKGKDQSYTYYSPGTYMPSLILSDSFGCTYVMPPTDTITVGAPPVVDFTFNGGCAGEPVAFDESYLGNIAFRLWDFGDGNNITSESPQHTYAKPGIYNVTLTLTTDFGCSESVTKTIKIGGVNTAMMISDTLVCAGQPIQFTDLSKGDTTIAGWTWYFGNGETSLFEHPQYFYPKTGSYQVSLVTRTVNGCRDSITGKTIIVGDTTMPVAPGIKRVSVKNDHSVIIDFEPSLAVDFVAYIVGREHGGLFKALDTIKDRNVTSYTDGEVNTLQQSYCYTVLVKNACGSITSVAKADRHCTNQLVAEPKVNAAMVKWSGYIGWDNISSYEIYRAVATNKNNFVKIGAVPSTEISFIDSTTKCANEYVYHVKALNGANEQVISWSDTAGVKPINIPYVEGVELVKATVVDDKQVYVEWKPSKADVKYYLFEYSSDGRNYKQLELMPPTQLSYTDNNVDVQNLQYSYRIRVVDSCGDISARSNIGRTIMLKIDTSEQGLPKLSWSDYLHWYSGVDYYEIQRATAGGGFEKIGRTHSYLETEFIDYFSELNSKVKYCYRIVAHKNGSDITSVSNSACLSAKGTIYIPTAFTPNHDLNNDTFFVKGMYITDYQITVYDRWGTKVFESSDINEGWLGDYKGKQAAEDVYAYIITAKGADRRKIIKKGMITLFR